MYKAEHEKMYQEANQILIDIRKQEIDYYMRVNGAIGTQASLIIGFVYLTFTQNVDFDYVWTKYFNTVYFISSAITMALATNVILCTTLIQLLGPGLALNGPIGSMAKATSGMKIEQTQVMTSFLYMMASFTVTTVLVFWVTMDFYSSIASTVCFIIAARYWLFFCSRIYHRFYWDASVTHDQAGNWRNRGSRASSDSEPTVQMRVSNSNNPIHRGNAHDLEGGEGHSSSSRPSEQETTNRGSIINMITGTHPDSSRASFTNSRASFSGKMVERMSNIVGIRPNDNTVSRQSMQASRPPVVTNLKDIIVEGFITMNLVSELKAKHWERRYVVLNYRGQMTYYKNRQDYRNDPLHTNINPRPLELDEYYVTPHKQESYSESSTITPSATGDLDGVVAKFSFSLTRKDDPSYTSWHYKHDTEEELDMWIAAMRIASPTSFKPMNLDV